MLSTSHHHRICEQLTIIEVHFHLSALHTLCNLEIHKIHATGRETFCTFQYSRIWVHLLPSLFHVHIFLYVQWLHTSPSHMLCTCVRDGSNTSPSKGHHVLFTLHCVTSQTQHQALFTFQCVTNLTSASSSSHLLVCHNMTPASTSFHLLVCHKSNISI